MSNQIYVASIEVDGRQKYIFETDKLKEMLGASQIMDHTRLIAQNDKSLIPEEQIFTSPVHVFQPVSGEVKLWCESEHRNIMLQQIWAFKAWLTNHGLQHTISLTQVDATHLQDIKEISNLTTHVHEKLIKKSRHLKNNKAYADARPRLSLFAACQIHGDEPANFYHQTKERNARRKLISQRAKEKLKKWEKIKQDFYQENLDQPFKKRIKSFLPDFLADTQRAISFADLTEDTETGLLREDQYIGFVCADGDGMGKLLGKLNWNKNIDYPDGNASWNDLQPWERNREFAIAYDHCVRQAFTKALAKTLIPDREKAEDYKQKFERDESIDLPLLPQLLGGDDLWMVADREIILDLCCNFGELYAQEVRDNATIKELLKAYTQNNNPEPQLTISMGVAFAKSSYPATQMIELAEQLLKKAKALRKGHLWARKGKTEGCLDFHWIESSRNESLEEARTKGWLYQNNSETFLLTTRPWDLTETQSFIKAAEKFAQLPRRKREQLEEILRLGYALSNQAWKSWLQNLSTSADNNELDILKQTNNILPTTLKLENIEQSPWILLKDNTYTTPWLDLLVMLQILGKEGKR